ILSIAITSIVMTYIETGINRKKSVMVMSEHYLEDIRLRLSAEIGRGLTLLEAKGGYNRKSKEVLLIVVTDHEFSRMKPLIEEIDPSAFVIVSSVAEVMGRGFTYHPIE
ncbi:TPA: YitT family protein, partial [Enterococcus faecium]|nr:YitT family protein [Enterococcus faecium]HBA0570599.1 YitT family protein [Enterococcus faecium]